jgi:hypothetical protein
MNTSTAAAAAKPRMISINGSFGVHRVATVLLRHFKGEQLDQLIALLAKAANAARRSGNGQP